MKRDLENDIKFYTDLLKDNYEYKDYNIDVLLYDKNNKPYIIASDKNNNAIEIRDYNNTKNIERIPEWDFNFDYYLYNLFEDDYEIGFIKDSIHSAIWNSINELYPYEIENKDGVIKYAEYCNKYDISKEYLEEKTGGDIPNIMNKFKIKVLYIEPGKLPVEMEIFNDLETKQKLVKGYIETAYLLHDKDVVIICNEEGKNLDMKLNRDIGYDIIAGPFILAGNDFDNGDFKSLNKDQIEKYKEYFNEKSISRTEARVNAIRIANSINYDREER